MVRGLAVAGVPLIGGSLGFLGVAMRGGKPGQGGGDGLRAAGLHLIGVLAVVAIGVVIVVAVEPQRSSPMP